METIINLLILGMCLNVGLAIVTEAMGISFGPGSGTNDFKAILNNTVIENDELIQNSTSGDEGFVNLTLIFGDWFKVIGIVINAISFQYIINIMQVFGLSDTAVLGVRAIGAILATFTIVYLISGRGSKQNI
jgi:hypothetical protein